MQRALLSFLLLAIAAAMEADTVIMKDGSRYTGTFVRGTSRMITITDTSGQRRDLDLTNVQELQFGNGAASTGDVSYTVGRLQNDLRDAVDNGRMDTRDRSTLQRASERLRVALDNYNTGSRVDMQEVRNVLADVRSIVNNSRLDDRTRQRLTDDLQQVEQLRWRNDR